MINALLDTVLSLVPAITGGDVVGFILVAIAGIFIFGYLRRMTANVAEGKPLFSRAVAINSRT